MRIYRFITISSILCFFFAMLICGCKKEVIEDYSNAIEFAASLERQSTKGVPIIGNELPSESHLGVFAYLCKNGIWQGNENPDFMYNVQLNSDGSYSNISADLKYWPDVSSKVKFFAYYPYDDQTSTDLIKLSPQTQSGPPTLIYTTPETVEDQIDLMATYTDALEKRAEPVILTLKHLLTKVGIFTKLDSSVPDDISISISSIIINNIYMQGRYGIDDFSWESYAQNIDYPILDAIYNISSQEYGNVLGADQYLLLIPQSLYDITIQITYTITTQEGSSTTYTKEKPLYGVTQMKQGGSLGFYLKFNPSIDSSMDLRIEVGNWEHVSINTTIN